MQSTRHVVARRDSQLVAVLTDLEPLIYADGGNTADDRPAHVRAASAVRRSGTRLVIVQDDVNVLALHTVEGILPVLLPLGEGGRRLFDDSLGNKRAKMDLEACAALPDGRLVAFGSGATGAREQLVVVDGSARVRLVPAPALFAGLRAVRPFAGSELNVEGALVHGDVLRLFQRGNGAPRGELTPVNATGDLPLETFLTWLDRGGAPPVLEHVVQFDLGAHGSARFGFTDAALTADGRVAFIACAEDSADAVQDGAILGCRFGLIEEDAVRMTEILDGEGRPSVVKLEGIESCVDDRRCFAVVADMDDPEEPAQLGRLRVTE